MAGWIKLDKGIIHSTVWREPDHVRLVWLAMLIMAESDGVVTASLPGLADSARVPIDKCKDALDRLSDPDEYSRTPDNEGRRIKRVDDGWFLFNYDAYRKTDRTATERQRRRRARLKDDDVTRDTGVTGRDRALHTVTGRDVTEPLSSCVRSPEGGASTGGGTGGSGAGGTASGSATAESGQQQGGGSTTATGSQPPRRTTQSADGGGQHGGGTATPPPTTASTNHTRTRSQQPLLPDTDNARTRDGGGTDLDPEAIRLARAWATQHPVWASDGGPGDAQLAKWADAFDKLNRLDGYSWDRLKALCRYICDDLGDGERWRGWAQNCRTPLKLRKRDKEDLLYAKVILAQLEAPKPKPRPSKSVSDLTVCDPSELNRPLVDQRGKGPKPIFGKR